VTGRFAALAILCALTGCRQLFGIDSTEVDVDADPAAPDAPPGPDATPGPDGPPGPDARACFGTGLEVVCLAQPPASPVVLPTMLVDTDSSPWCATVVSATTPACVIAGAGVQITGRVRAVGARPLVVIAVETLQISVAGGIDVASPRGDVPGAAASGATCPIGAATGSGGGAGGSFGDQGGDGGDGAEGGNPGSAGPAGAPTSLRGGCPGGPGGGSSADRAGAGGGAVYLIATDLIRIEGEIDASGGGGAGGLPSSDGGSGGGAGGFIGFDAPSTEIAPGGRVFANGGGGGEAAGAGSTGADGTSSLAPQSPGQGGAGTNGNAGDGGDGGYNTIDARRGDNGQSSGGGGGGGGSVGIIRGYGGTLSVNGLISPPPS
jgi:hypothetical protein